MAAYLDEDDQKPFSGDNCYVVIDDETVNMIKKSLTIWGDRINQFAEQYLKDDRKEIELFNDIVTPCQMAISITK